MLEAINEIIKKIKKLNSNHLDDIDPLMTLIRSVQCILNPYASNIIINWANPCHFPANFADNISPKRDVTGRLNSFPYPKVDIPIFIIYKI